MNSSNSADSSHCSRRRRPDVRFEHHGSIWLVRPLNGAARRHLEANVGADALWFAHRLSVEPRYVEALALALATDGMVLA